VYLQKIVLLFNDFGGGKPIDRMHEIRKQYYQNDVLDPFAQKQTGRDSGAIFESNCPTQGFQKQSTKPNERENRVQRVEAHFVLYRGPNYILHQKQIDRISV
jgi:hypothetical protein